MDLPGNLSAMINSLPQGHRFTEDQFINQHTLYPYYAFTLTPAQASRLRNGMKGDGKSLHIGAGIVANSVPKLRTARFCRQCAIEDVSSIGEPYWHLTHQIPGVEVCHKHACLLELSTYQYRGNNQRYQLISARKAITASSELPKLDKDNKEHHINLYLAKEAQWLLNSVNRVFPRNELRERYVSSLIKKDLATYTGHVKAKRFHNEFLKLYPKKFLKQLNLEDKPSVNIYWLERFFHARHTAMSPIQHLLVMYFLGETVESLLKVPYQKTPFGSGPWPCLNRVCRKYKLFSITSIRITHKDAQPVGLFRCEICGFTYNRRGPDRSPEDIFRRNHIIDPGKIWEKKLRQLKKDPSMSLREKSRQLGVATRTVEKHEHSLFFKKKKSKKTASTYKSHSQRAAWKKLRKANPTLSIKYLRTKNQALYAWLYRNDSSWLKINRPVRKKQKKMIVARVDWNLRDRTSAPKIPKVAKQIISRKGKPTRASIKAISQVLGLSSWFEKKLDKLPICKRALLKAAESRVEYGLRRLAWAKQYCRKNLIPPNRSTLIRLAGIDRIKHIRTIKQMLDQDQ